jgi:hypothetical protein
MFSVKGGLFHRINLTKEFTIDKLLINDSISKHLYPFGMGHLTVMVIVNASNAEPYCLQKDMTLFLLLVIKENAREPNDVPSIYDGGMK